MPVYSFRGTNPAGATVTGERMAESRAALQQMLRRERITPLVIKEKGKEFALPTFRRGVSQKDLAIFTRQFSVMIDAGLPLVQCLEILGNQQENRTLQKAILGARSSVEGGSSLANALRQYPNVFDDLYTNMVEAGETGGILDGILQRLSSYIEKAVKLRAAVKGAMIYPVAIMSIMALVIILLLWKVVPVFHQLFLDLGAELPLPTRMVIGMSQFVGSWLGFITIVVVPVAIFVLLRTWYRTPGGRYALDAAILKIPLIGEVMRKIAVARMTRTLGTLITSGVAILEALAITARTSGNAVIERALMAVRKAVEEGRTIVDPLRQSDVFPAMVSQMIGVGEQTGALDAMLQKIADFYEDEVDAAVKNLLTAMEPIMLLILGVVVGGVVISMYLPLFSLISKLSTG
ncbi:MAG: type II secretion system F family protein [Acidobacteria bacterium]|nr:type II secretion system F family protein [Acidobacteriota bacterium]